MDADFRDLERHREDLLAAEEAARPDEFRSEPCDSFASGGPENLVGDETCASCGFSEADHGARGEHLREALEVERHQERKHEERGR